MPAGEGCGLSDGVVSEWTGENGGQPGCFVRSQVRGGFPKMMTGRGFCPVHAASPFRDIEIQLEDPFFAQPVFQRARDQGLTGLPEQRTF